MKNKLLDFSKKLIIIFTAMVSLTAILPQKSHASLLSKAATGLFDIIDDLGSAVLIFFNGVVADDRSTSYVSFKANEDGANGDIWNFRVTPYDIFVSGGTVSNATIDILNANFFSTSNSSSSKKDSVGILKPVISSVYQSLRNIAIVIMLIVLVYVGIRIIISSAAQDQAKYRKLLKDWLVGMCLLFFMHYIMVGISYGSTVIINILKNDERAMYNISLPNAPADSDGLATLKFLARTAQTLGNTRTVTSIASQLITGKDVFQTDQGSDNFWKNVVSELAGSSMAEKLMVPSQGDTFSINEKGIITGETSGYKEGTENAVRAFSQLGNTNFETPTDVLEFIKYTDQSYYYEVLSTLGITEKTGKVNEDGTWEITYNFPEGLMDDVAYKQQFIDKFKDTTNSKTQDISVDAIIISGDEDRNNGAIYKANLMEYIKTITSVPSAYVCVRNSDDTFSILGSEADDDGRDTVKLGYMILFLALVIETIMFVWIYIKRVIQLAFYTMIAPIIALMYPIDKIGDGQAQAFNKWFRDYLFTTLLQPMHLLLYTIFIASAKELFSAGHPIYACVLYGFMIPSEKYLKDIFGFGKATSGGGSPLAGMVLGGLGMRGFDMLTKMGPHRGRGGKGGSGGSDRQGKIFTPPKRKPTGTEGAEANGAVPNALPNGDINLPNNRGRGGNRQGNQDPGRLPTGRRGSFGRGIGTAVDRMPILGRRISRALTGGASDHLSGYKKEVIQNIARKGLRGAGRVAGVATLGSAGLAIGAATAMATGDVSNLAKVSGTGILTGWTRGADLGGAIANTGINLHEEINEVRAENDQEFADQLRRDNARKEFSSSGVKLSNDQIDAVNRFAPYIDFKGDEDLLNAVIESEANGDTLNDTLDLDKTTKKYGNLNLTANQKSLMRDISARIDPDDIQLDQDEINRRVAERQTEINDQISETRRAATIDEIQAAQDKLAMEGKDSSTKVAMAKIKAEKRQKIRELNEKLANLQQATEEEMLKEAINQRARAELERYVKFANDSKRAK